MTFPVFLLFLAVSTLVQNCSEHSPPAPPPEATGPVLGRRSPEVGPLSEAEERRRACEARLRQVLKEPVAPGAPTFEQNRFEILMAAKAEPVLLTRAPDFTPPTEEVSAAVRSFRTLLGRTKHPWDVLKKLLEHFRHFPQDGRQTLLREGYLYADNPELAFALVSLVSAEHLFGHDEIWLQRGQFVYHAKRRRGRYYFTDGPNQGESVRLLLLDRLGAEPAPSEPLARDLRALRARVGFREALIRRVTDTHIIANLKYGPYSVPTVLRSTGAQVDVECEIIDESMLSHVADAKAFDRRRQLAMRALQATMALQIEDQLPFDEPRREFGNQLDGVLRRNWRAAYFAGRNSFAYNGDRYAVFNALGRVAVPEVCVDFLTDTIERASGTWWTPKGAKAALNMGNFDFGSLDIMERARMRRVPEFVQYANDHPGLFDVLTLDKRERIPMGESKAFAGYLHRERAEYQPGDIVVIRGVTPWDRRTMHYHSFFIYETDPISGVPLALVGNAGRPSVRNWAVEARRTPKRSIWHRLRPRTEWIEEILPEGYEVESTPPPLSPVGNAG